MDLMLLRPTPMWHCLTCGQKIPQFDFDTNNGVCFRCPKLTEIAAAFWPIISRVAAMGDLNAQATMEKYG